VGVVISGFVFWVEFLVKKMDLICQISKTAIFKLPYFYNRFQQLAKI